MNVKNHINIADIARVYSETICTALLQYTIDQLVPVYGNGTSKPIVLVWQFIIEGYCYVYYRHDHVYIMPVGDGREFMILYADPDSFDEVVRIIKEEFLAD